jgi:hypothetical protein
MISLIESLNSTSLIGVKIMPHNSTIFSKKQKHNVKNNHNALINAIRRLDNEIGKILALDSDLEAKIDDMREDLFVLYNDNNQYSFANLCQGLKSFVETHEKTLKIIDPVTQKYTKNQIISKNSFFVTLGLIAAGLSALTLGIVFFVASPFTLTISLPIAIISSMIGLGLLGCSAVTLINSVGISGDTIMYSNERPKTDYYALATNLVESAEEHCKAETHFSVSSEMIEMKENRSFNLIMK